MKYFTIIIALIFISKITFSQEYFITDYGAVGDGKTDNTEAIQAAVNECSKNGGCVVFPSGTFLSGTVFLKSDVTVHLTQKAVWQGFPDLDVYPDIEPEISSRMDMTPWKAFIYAYNQKNITIEGKGMIYPSGDSEVFQMGIGENPDRPYGLHMVKCTNVTVRDVFMKNSAFWMQRYFACTGVRIHGITVFNHSNYNNDGCDIDGCRDVVISDCKIDASDDALVFKSESMHPCENVVVNNCILSSHASPLKWGTASVGGFKRFSISNIVIRPSEADHMIHTLEAWGGLSGIDLGNVDGGIMQDITISNVVMSGVETAIFIRLGARHDRPWTDQVLKEGGTSKNIRISNVTATNIGKISSSITGYEGNPVQNVSLNNVFISTTGGGTLQDTALDILNQKKSYPVNRMFKTDMPSYGFYVRYAENIKFNNVQIETVKKDERPAFVLSDVEGLRMVHPVIQQPESDLAAIRIEKSKGIEITGDGGVNELNDLICVEDTETKDIALHANNYDQLHHLQPPKEFHAETFIDNNTRILLTWEKPVQDDGNILSYILYRNGEEILQTRKQKYLDADVKDGKVYHYSIVAASGEGDLSGKKSVEIKSAKDRVRPRVVGIRFIDNTTTSINFSEPLKDRVMADAANYSFSPEVRILSVDFQGDVVILHHDPVQSYKGYELVISRMVDRSSSENTVKNKSHTITDEPLIAYWNFNEQSNGSYVSEKSSHRARPVHIKSVEGVKGKGVSFNGVGSYLDAGYHTSYETKGDIAFSVWLKLDDPVLDNYMRVFSRRKAWDQPAGYEFEINPANSRVNFSGGNLGATDQGIMNHSFSDGWHHYVGMIKDGQAELYVDGVKVGEDDEVALPISSTYPLIIGATSALKDFYYGDMDELYLFNRALSPEEIQSLYKKNYSVQSGL